MVINGLIDKAKRMGASDLHLTSGCPPAVRVNGKIIFMAEMSLNEKILTDFAEHLLDSRQKQQFCDRGEVDFACTYASVRCRINVFRQGGCPAIAVRIINSAPPDCSELKLPEAVCRLADLKQGLVLITGATGSGKTTTMAALINRINHSDAKNIITLEDPVEYKHEHILSMINQREIGVDTESFSSGLKSALRQDPDIIMVGELRDKETVATALTAAETGHLVLATLHTRDAVSTVNRIIDIFTENQNQIRSQLAECLQAIVAQELLYSEKQQRRVAVFEIMTATQAVRNLIREGKTYQIKSFIQTGGHYGMITKEDYLKQLRQQDIL